MDPTVALRRSSREPSPQWPAACPQCAAVLSVPQRGDMFSCPWCGSALSPVAAPRTSRSWQRVFLDRDAAERTMRSWLAGSGLPAGAETASRLEVGERRWFPFLRLRGSGKDRVEPLAEAPSADVLQLAGIPAAWLPEGELPQDHSLEPDHSESGDEAFFRMAQSILQTAGDGLTEVVLERRAFYEARYWYGDQPFTAVVDAGSGTVCAARRPAASEVPGARWIATVTAALLLAESLVLPGLTFKIGVVLVTSVVLYLMVKRRVVDR